VVSRLHQILRQGPEQLHPGGCVRRVGQLIQQVRPGYQYEFVERIRRRTLIDPPGHRLREPVLRRFLRIVPQRTGMTRWFRSRTTT